MDNNKQLEFQKESNSFSIQDTIKDSLDVEPVNETLYYVSHNIEIKHELEDLIFDVRHYLPYDKYTKIIQKISLISQ